MQYTKQVLGYREAARRLASTALSAPALFDAFRSERVNWQLSEKLMLAVTAVLECRYCNWVHSELAERVGVEVAEIESILAGKLESLGPDEYPAMQYARGYALRQGKANKSMRVALHRAYGAEMARDIELLVAFVYLTNKLGNTFDAFVARMHGIDSEHGSRALEVGVFLSLWPVYGAVGYLTRKGRSPLSIPIEE